MIRKTLTIMKEYWKVFITICVIFIGLLFYFRSQGYVWMDFTGFEGKTVWDVLELMIIPASLTLFAIYLDKQEKNVDRQNARMIAEESQQEIVIQSYFGAIEKLILDKGLKESVPEDTIRDIAQLKTTSTLARLKTDRKSNVIRFLCEVSLINCEDKSNPIINLINVNLRFTDLVSLNLKGARLDDACLEKANLSHTDLQYASLWRADLRQANLQHAKMMHTNLEFSNLKQTNLLRTNLNGANLLYANLEGANLKGVTLFNAKYNNDTCWPDGFDYVAAGAINVDE